MKQNNITEEQKSANKTLFLETNKKYGVLSDEFLEFLGEGLFSNAASTKLELHNAFEGGLVDHILRTAKYAGNINKTLPDALKQDITSIIKVVFLAEIGKVGLYEKETSDWHVKNLGRVYNFKNDIVAMTVSERSLFYAAKFNTVLKDSEFSAIANYEKDETDKQSYWHGDTLGLITKMACRLAIEEEKFNFKSVQ